MFSGEQEENKQEHAVHAHPRGVHCTPRGWPCFGHVLYMFLHVLLVFSLNTCLGQWRTIQYKRHVPRMYNVYYKYRTCRTHIDHVENKHILILCMFLILKIVLADSKLKQCSWRHSEQSIFLTSCGISAISFLTAWGVKPRRWSITLELSMTARRVLGIDHGCCIWFVSMYAMKW